MPISRNEPNTIFHILQLEDSFRAFKIYCNCENFEAALALDLDCSWIAVLCNGLFGANDEYQLDSQTPDQLKLSII